MTARDRHEQLSNIGYLRPIMHPITQVLTVQQCLQTAAEISQRLQQSHTFVTFDLAAAKLALSIVWHKPDEFQNVTVLYILEHFIPFVHSWVPLEK